MVFPALSLWTQELSLEKAEERRDVGTWLKQGEGVHGTFWKTTMPRLGKGRLLPMSHCFYERFLLSPMAHKGTLRSCTEKLFRPFEVSWKRLPFIIAL